LNITSVTTIAPREILSLLPAISVRLVEIKMIRRPCVIRLFALPTTILAATIGYGATLLGSEVPNRPYVWQAPREAATIAWTQVTGSYLGSTNVQCLLAPSHDCHAVLFDGGNVVAARRSPQPPALVFESGPPLPVVNPYSGTFVTFPLR
jgi:hypothetical protein